MYFYVTADTDIGTSRNINQDSILVKHGKYDGGEVLMAIVCDGMGGLCKGELASATVIRAFLKWYEEILPWRLRNFHIEEVNSEWFHMLDELNRKISLYGQQEHTSLGTTFTGILFVNDLYMLLHVGDTRAYYIGNTIRQLTEDHTFVAREVRYKRMTAEQAKNDRRRNQLLQCIGASDFIEPQFVNENTQEGLYMLCSDGFRHEITDLEMYESFDPDRIRGEKDMLEISRKLINRVKERSERDNISVILIKAFQKQPGAK